MTRRLACITAASLLWACACAAPLAGGSDAGATRLPVVLWFDDHREVMVGRALGGIEKFDSLLHLPDWRWLRADRQ